MRCQRYDPNSPRVKEWSGGHQQCCCTLFDERRKCSLQLSIVSSVRKLDLPNDCASRLLHIPHLGFMPRIVRIYKHAENGCTRRQLLQQA